MKIVGICGSSGSGKSTVSKYFQEHGIPVLDCDKIYHTLVESPSDCLAEIGEKFGNDLIQNGYLDRKKLGNIVFQNREKLEILNEISHRHVILELEKRIAEFSKSNLKSCIIDAPLLFESGLDKRCDAIIAVISDEKQQIKRICERDGIDEASAKIRIHNQKDANTLSELADFVIHNNGTYEELLLQCEKIRNKIFTKKGE